MLRFPNYYRFTADYHRFMSNFYPVFLSRNDKTVIIGANAFTQT